MTRLLAALCTLLLAATGEAQTWAPLPVPSSTVYQPYLGGNQSIHPLDPGAAVTVCPRPVTLSARIFRSFSTFTCGPGGCISIGGGHAGHPGNDIDLYDPLTQAWRLPFTAECPPPYTTTTVSAPYAAGGTVITLTDVAGFTAGQTIFLHNTVKTKLKIVSLAGKTVTVSGLANPGAAAVGTLASTAGGTYRGVRGGAVATGGFSPTGRPWVHHTYDSVDWDSVRGRWLFMSGNGLGAYSPAGAWTQLAGRNTALKEVTFGEAGATVFDATTDSVYLFVSDARNGGARGVYKYTFNPDGSIAMKTYLHAWPIIANWGWSYKTINATQGPGRTVYLALRPTASTTNVPPQRLFTYHLDTAAVVWDQTLAPPNLAYDQVTFNNFARRATTGEVYFPVSGTGAWVKSEATNMWAFATIPQSPSLAQYTFTYHAPSDSFLGMDVSSVYCDVGGVACGGPAIPWRLSFAATLPPVAVIDTFTATPMAVVAGQSVVLSWTTSNTAAVTLNGIAVAADGSQTVTPLTTTPYDLVAGGVSGRVIVTVTPAPTINSFTATPPVSYVGKPVVLNWNTANAIAVTLNGAAVVGTGTQTVSPVATTHYDLLADGISKRVTVVVTEDPLEFSIGGKKYRLEPMP